jgi:bifunctional DNA-binding transcriptional regulator/antitoxin component of YhaV-PrlF toxin-antitoxin module
MGCALTSKRQVTVPIQICQQFGIGPGREIDFVTLVDGRVLMTATPENSTSIDSAIEKWRGKIGLKKSTEEIVRGIRGFEAMR